MKATDPDIVVSQVFDHPKSEIWKIITTHTHMVNWFFEAIPDFKPLVGFKTKFNVKAPSRDFMHLWEITEVIPEEKIVYNWRYEGLKGNSFVTFELETINDKTKLIVIAKTVEDFDAGIPEFKSESCQQGWEYFITERLVSYLNRY